MRAATACALSASSLSECRRTQFIGNDTEQIVLKRKLIDDRQCIAGIAENLNASHDNFDLPPEAAPLPDGCTRTCVLRGSAMKRPPSSSTTIR